MAVYDATWVSAHVKKPSAVVGGSTGSGRRSAAAEEVRAASRLFLGMGPLPPGASDPALAAPDLFVFLATGTGRASRF